MTEDNELLDCFPNLPEVTPGANETSPSPLNFEWPQSKQSQDALIQSWVQKHPQKSKPDHLVIMSIWKPLSNKEMILTWTGK